MEIGFCLGVFFSTIHEMESYKKMFLDKVLLTKPRPHLSSFCSPKLWWCVYVSRWAFVRTSGAKWFLSCVGLVADIYLCHQKRCDFFFTSGSQGIWEIAEQIFWEILLTNKKQQHNAMPKGQLTFQPCGSYGFTRADINPQFLFFVETCS